MPGGNEEKNMCEFVNFRRPSFLKDIFFKSKMSEEEIGKCLFEPPFI